MNVALRPALELTVIIPTSRPLAAVVPTLDALARQTVAPDRYEVVVVLDGPDRGRAEGLRMRRDPYALTTVAGPGRGRGPACNAGLAIATGAIVLLLDDDMAPRPDALAAHLARHAGTAALAVMGAVPVQVRAGGPFVAGYTARRFARHMAKLARARTPIGARDVYTGAFSVPRGILQHLGGFDERIREYGNEDGELARRLLRAGVAIIFAPEAVSDQSYDKGFHELAADHVAKGRTAVRFAELHPERDADSGLERLRRGSRARRAARGLLARAARVAWRRRLLLAAAARVGSALEPVRPALSDRLTSVVLEACFQVGVWQASAPRRTGPLPRTIVHYCDSSAAGGAERVALTILSGLDRSRWRPVLVVHDHPELLPLVTESRALGIECRVAPRRRTRAGLLDVPALIRTFRQLRPAVAHIHRAWAPSGGAGIIAAVLARVPVRVTTEHLFLASTPRRVIWLRRLLLDRLVHRHIAVSRAIGDALRDQLRVPTDRIVIVANGIVAPPAPAPAAVRATRRPLGLPDGAPLVVVPAQLRRQKGHEVLLDALPQLPEVVAAFAGDGPERQGLAARAAAAGITDRVRFLGHRRDLPALLTAGDIVVLPSTAEGLPLAVLEALALGRPVVASAVGGTPEVVEHDVTGLLVPPRDAHALAAAIRSLLADPARATRLGAAGRRAVQAHFTARRMVAQTAALYEKLLAATSRPQAAPRMPAARTIDVRAADWRYLGGRDRFDRLAVFTGASAAPQRAEADETVPGEQAAAASCDGARAEDAGATTLTAVRSALAPGGTACLRFRAAVGRSPAHLVERVRNAGFGDPRAYAPWPSERNARAWLPLDDAAARARVLHKEAPTWRARAGRLRRQLWEVRAMTGMAGPVDVIAQTGPSDVETLVRRAWPDAVGAPAPARLSWLLLTGGREPISKVVAVAVAAGTRGPGIVVKWPRTAAAGAGLAREAGMLRRLAAGNGAPPGDVPRLLFEQPTAMGPAVGQTLLDGVPLTRHLDRTSYPVLAFAAIDWLARLACRAPTAASPRADQARLGAARAASRPGTGALARAFLECAEPALDAGLIRDALALLDSLAELPPVIEHRDFAPWNLLSDERDSLRVVDWESAVPAGLPFLDAWYFLTHLALAAERRRVASLADVYVDVTSPSRRVLHDAVERYVAFVGVPMAAVPALRAATWMVHLPSEVRRLAAGGDAVAPAQVRRATFARLCEIEVRRATGARLAKRST